jgi:SpoVK/Ycf46/Vps4 family AAA+-type ATPase
MNKTSDLFLSELNLYFKAGFPCLLIKTSEEARICSIMQSSPFSNILVWNNVDGLTRNKAEKVSTLIKDFENSTDLMTCLLSCLMHERQLSIENKEGEDISNLYIMKDIGLYDFKDNPNLNRSLKEFILAAKNNGSCIVILSEVFNIPVNLERLITVHDFPLPSEEDLAFIMDNIIKSSGLKEINIDKKSKEYEKIIQAASGLDQFEAENAFSKSIIAKKKIDVDIIYKEKIKAVKRNGMLEIIEPEKDGLDAIGGLENLKEWLIKRKNCFTKEAKEFGLPNPKGFLIVGIPGSGKSLVAKTIGTAFNLPTVRLDLGSLFGSLVGQSEERTRNILKLIESLSPVVLFIDEIEKGLAGSSGSSTDGGTTQRVFGTIISWMQDRKAPVFLVATANKVTSIPSEFLRKGRFDEIWSTDLPNDIERKEIFKIHLTKKRTEEQTKIREIKSFNIEKLIEVSKDFTGAEIEQCIISALNHSFNENKDVTTDDIVNAFLETKSLNIIAPEQVNQIREWIKNKGRNASKTYEEIKINKTDNNGGRKLRTNN